MTPRSDPPDDTMAEPLTDLGIPTKQQHVRPGLHVGRARAGAVQSRTTLRTPVTTHPNPGHEPTTTAFADPAGAEQPTEERTSRTQPPVKRVTEDRPERGTFSLRRRTLSVTAISVVLMGGSATAVISQAFASPHPAHAHDQHVAFASATRRARHDEADRETIQAAARMRRIGLAPHRTAYFRAFAGYLGLRVS
jgi:hypothetical protein